MISWQKQQHITSGLMPSGRTATREIKLRGISYKNEIQISLLISWHYHLFILMNFSIKRLSPLIKGGTMLFRIPKYKFCPIYYFMIFDGEIRHVIMEMISYLSDHYFPVVVHHFPNCRAFLAIKEASSSVIQGPIGMHIACSEK